MEEYRVKLKLQNLFIGIICMILAIFSFLMALSETGVITWMPAVNGDSHVQSMWRGFLFGASFGLLGFMVFGLIRNIRALKDENILKKHYIQDTDERQIKIWTAARALSMQIFVIAGLVAGIIAAYFSMTVGITIIACVFVHSMIGLFCKIYFDIKF
jgi:hypothetical protein